MLDVTGHVLTWNPSAERLFGYSPAEAVQLTLADLQPTERPTEGSPTDDVAHVLADAATHGRVERQGRHITRDGRQLWTSTVVCPIRDEHGVLQGFAEIVHDQTALRQAEELLAARTIELERSNRDLAAFASVASHDLKEPLRKILAFSDRFRKQWCTGLPDEATRTLVRIQDATVRMQRLIDSLLAFSTLGRSDTAFGMADLGKVARDVRADLDSLLQSSGGALEIGPLPAIQADASQMHRLLQNLIGTQVRPAGRSAARLGHELEARRRPVGDHGRGQRHRLRATSRGAHLWPARTFARPDRVRRLGHRSGDQPQGGRGASGNDLRRRAARRRFGVHGGTAASTKEALMTSKHLTILVADDDPDDREFTRDAFDASDVTNPVFFVENGEQVMDYVNHTGSFGAGNGPDLPSLILLDLDMPRMNGHETLAALKADPRLPHIPIIVLSGAKAHAIVLESYNAGASSFITKPVTFDALVEVLRNVRRYWLDTVRLPAEPAAQ